MAQTTMYAGMSNSPKTSLVDDISANDTTIVLADASVLPDAPNLAVIGETAEAEVIIYSGMSGNRLTGVLRRQGGTQARAWPANTSVARNFTIIDYDNICNNIRDLEARKQNSSDDVDLVTQVTGSLGIANGGTGTTSIEGIKSLLSLAALAYKTLVDLGVDVSGILGEANGGTGQVSLQATRNAMGLGDTTGALPPENGGTGQTSLSAARNALGLGNTVGPVPVENGGTNSNNSAGARTSLGITDIATRPNYIISSANITPGSSALPSGTLYFYYEV